MKILNLYSGIGGNRKMWGNVHKVTSVERDENIGKTYRRIFGNDTLIIGDAHQYLLDHFSEFDFIWSSPPCPSHGQYRHNVGVLAKGYKPIFPDMKLYEEIIFLQNYFKGKWVVENVRPYYTPLINPTSVIGRHLFWSNFDIPLFECSAKNIRSKNKISDYASLGFDLSDSGIKNKRQVLRNCVDSKLAMHILSARNNHRPEP